MLSKEAVLIKTLLGGDFNTTALHIIHMSKVHFSLFTPFCLPATLGLKYDLPVESLLPSALHFHSWAIM